MNRKKFIQQNGATCANWNWSWSFINKEEKFIIFGAWDLHTSGRRQLILDDAWQTSRSGKKNAGYKQSIDHIKLVEKDGYRLYTFPMKYSNAIRDKNESGPAKIGGFVPKLTEKKLLRVDKQWFAADLKNECRIEPLAEELLNPTIFTEGAKFTVTVNGYERNPKARAVCIKHYGDTCAVCKFDFGEIFGTLGEGFIHVHHVVPIGTIGKEYQIDPIKDLIPVCPNCHAMIHRTEPPLLIEDLRKHIQQVAAVY